MNVKYDPKCQGLNLKPFLKLMFKHDIAVIWVGKCQSTRIEKYILSYIQNSKFHLTDTVTESQTVALKLNNMRHRVLDNNELFKWLIPNSIRLL